MATSHMVRQRLINQQISCSGHTQPAELVGWFGAIQAQDYLATKWAVGLRLPQSTDAAIEQAIADKTIIRTWALRNTIHLIAAADIHWMLALLRPRLRQLVGSHHRRLGIDQEVLMKSQNILAQTLTGSKQLTRPELKIVLERAGIRTDDIRLNLLLGWASIEGLLCFGCRRGNDFTHTLLDEWVPARRHLTWEEALAELAIRYFRSHGPATLADFVWWSGLTVTDAKIALALNKSSLLQETVDNNSYWVHPPFSTPNDQSVGVHLLPAFDEYLVAYKDRRAVLGKLDFSQIISAGNGIFQPVIVADGQVVGTWKRTIKKDRVRVETNLFLPLSAAHQQAMAAEIGRYSLFIGFTA